jgi:hypothetical protein
VRFTLVAMLLLGGCFSEPTYEGRLCDQSSPCPAGLSCVEGRCQLLVPADSGEPDSGEPDAGDLGRDGGPTQPDAGKRPDAGSDAAIDAGMDSGMDGGAPRDAEPRDADPLDATDGVDAMPDGGSGLCVPGETRPCYSGPVGTQGVGICSEGVSTCDGTDFGPCEDEVLPGMETCNGDDDDCDRVVDDGCPTGAVAFTGGIDTALTGWLPFGDTWAGEGCSPGDVVVGFFGHYADYLNEVGEHCDTPTIVEDASTTPHTYSLVLMPSASAAPRGGAMGTVYNGLCPAGTMVVEISGRSGSWIDRLSFTCAEFELIDLTQPGGAPRFEIREVPNSRTLIPLRAGGPGGSPFDLPCPNDHAASVRLRGALGSTTCCPLLVTTLGLTCSELEVSLR